METRGDAATFQHLLADLTDPLDLFYAELLQKELQSTFLTNLKHDEKKRILDLKEEDFVKIKEDRDVIESGLQQHFAKQIQGIAPVFITTDNIKLLLMIIRDLIDKRLDTAYFKAVLLSVKNPIAQRELKQDIGYAFCFHFFPQTPLEKGEELEKTKIKSNFFEFFCEVSKYQCLEAEEIYAILLTKYKVKLHVLIRAILNVLDVPAASKKDFSIRSYKAIQTHTMLLEIDPESIHLDDIEKSIKTHLTNFDYLSARPSLLKYLSFFPEEERKAILTQVIIEACADLLKACKKNLLRKKHSDLLEIFSKLLPPSMYDEIIRLSSISTMTITVSPPIKKISQTFFHAQDQTTPRPRSRSVGDVDDQKDMIFSPRPSSITHSDKKKSPSRLHWFKRKRSDANIKLSKSPPRNGKN